MKLRARWTGPLPRVGDYLASTTKPRYAYCIRSVAHPDSIVRWDPEQKAEVRRLVINVDRVPVAKVKPSARLHPWRWDKRSSRKALVP